MQQQKSKVTQQNQNQLASEVELIVLQARRVAADATTVEALLPHVEKVMKDMGVDPMMAKHVRRELEAKGITLGRKN